MVFSSLISPPTASTKSEEIPFNARHKDLANHRRVTVLDGDALFLEASTY